MEGLLIILVLSILLIWVIYQPPFHEILKKEKDHFCPKHPFNPKNVAPINSTWVNWYPSFKLGPAVKGCATDKMGMPRCYGQRQDFDPEIFWSMIGLQQADCQRKCIKRPKPVC